MAQKGLHEKISSLAITYPDRIAIEYGQKWISYGQLNSNAARMAGFITDFLGDTSVILLYMDKCPALVESILGILKAGRMFCPLDPHYPNQRVGLMLDEALSDWVFVQEKWLDRLNELAAQSGKQLQVCVVDSSPKAGAQPYSHLITHFLDEAAKLPIADIPLQKNSYIYFTSGSTGKPKAIVGRHRSLLHFIEWQTKEFGIDASVRVSQLTSPSFDPFLRDVFLPLYNGGTLCIPEQDELVLHPTRLAQWIDEHEISLLHMVPSLFRTLLQALPDANCFHRLRYIFLAGEMLRGNDIRRFIQWFGHRVQLVNLYGPTETTLAKMFYRIQPQDVFKITIPVGKPIDQTEILILNEDGRKCKTETTGELFIRTPFISSGYYRDRELTKSKFIPNPFTGNPNDIIYRTGDLGRWTKDGQVELIGRSDQQVKIRGNRVELGEVENALLGHPAVKQAAVLAEEEEDGTKSLYAYYSAGEGTSGTELREYVSQQLPEYMIPSFFAAVEQMPFLPNGKINRQALSLLIAQASTGTPYVAPNNRTEQILVSIWEEVLNKDSIGIHDSFFDLGGHSLKAARMITAIQKELHVDVPLKLPFTLKTVKELAAWIEQHAGSVGFQGIPQAEPQSYYPVSPAQKRMFVTHQTTHHPIHYNITKSVILEGNVDGKRIEDVLRHLIARHESLRTSFELVDGEPVQRVRQEVDFRLMSRKTAGTELEAAAAAAREFVQPFDIGKAPLFRAGLVELAKGRHLLLFDLHHIVADGVSMAVLVKEFVRLYEGHDLPELRNQYKDFAVWQAERLTAAEMAGHEAYWTEQFADEIPVLELPVDYARPAVLSQAGDQVQFTAGVELASALKRLALTTGSTLHMVLLAAYNVLLAKYSGQDDIVVGTPVAGRRHADLDGVIGMFVVTLALRNRPEGRKPFTELLRGVKENVLTAYEHQEYPFELLLERLHIRRDLSRHPLFDTMLVVQNMEHEQFQMKGVTVSSFPFVRETSRFDITLEAAESEDELFFTFIFNSGLLRQETVERMAGHFLQILRVVTERPDTRIAEIDMLTEEEKHLLLTPFNDTNTPYPDGMLLHELFEAQAGVAPERVALLWGEETVTYGELNREANRLARLLRRKGVKGDQPVALMAERGPLMIAAVLGILKAGGAYVPVDPAYPEERIAYMLEDCGAQLLVANPILNVQVRFHGERIDLSESVWAGEDGTNLEKATGPDQLAYIIYTSGTTGRPKGVMIEHRGIVNTLWWRKEEYQLGEHDTALQLFSFAFDGFVTSLFTPLVSGAAVVLVRDGEEKNALSIRAYIVTNKVTHMICVPALYLAVLDCLSKEETKSLRQVVLAGDRVHPRIVENSLRMNPNIELVNEYGPTENSVATTFYRKMDPDCASVVGKPIANTRLYVLSRDRQLLPIGIPGELYISGCGLARGYLNLAEQTKEMFTPNPWTPNERIYRTGDMVRRLADGNLEIIGRIDQQVKIRGYRIEISEIEWAIRKHLKVNDCVVTDYADSHGSRNLCAYYTADETISEAECKLSLAQSLPHYMVPVRFVRLASLPLSFNGKVDLKGLPHPSEIQGNDETYVPPSHEMERILVDVWQQVLGIGKVGIQDNFFELGGDSIKAIQVCARLYKHQLLLETVDLFQHPTIKQLQTVVKSVTAVIDQGTVSGNVKLTPIQRMFFEQKLHEPQHWNQSVMLYKQSGFVEALVQRGFQQLMEHHDVLRIIFLLEEDPISQNNRDTTTGSLFEMETFYLMNQADQQQLQQIIEQKAASLQAGLSLSEGPLVRIGLFKTTAGDHLLIIIHHLVVDVVSWTILLEDFRAAYELAERNEPVQLPLKTHSFKAWSEQLQQYAESDACLQEISYWQEVCGTVCPPLPKDFEAAENLLSDSETLTCRLSPEETDQLLKQVHTAYGTEINDVLLASLGMAVYQWANQERVVIDLEGHGREPVIEGMNVSRTVGWFTVQYPLVLEICDELSALIKATKEKLRSVPIKGIGYGILKYLTPVERKRQFRLDSRPEIAFNYLGQFDQDLNNGWLERSPFSPGPTKNPQDKKLHAFDMVSLIESGQLLVSLNYSTKQYKRTTMETFLGLYLSSLRSMISHCLQKDARELTPSDFSAKGLSIEEMDNIFELLEGQKS